MLQEEYYILKLKEKTESFIECCVPCILSEKKKEGELKPIPKGDVSLNTYHLGHLDPMTSTSKFYKYLLVIMDGFSKFVRLFPTKTTNTKEIIDKLTAMQQIFSNPRRVIMNRGAAFTNGRCVSPKRTARWSLRRVRLDSIRSSTKRDDSV